LKPLRLIKDIAAFQSEVVTRAFDYEEGVETGRIVACNYLKKAVRRSKELRKKYSYSEAELRRVASLFYYMYIPVNDRPTQFLPAPWQCWILLNLFGTIDPENGKRLFNEALIFVSRKSGKTMFGAALAIIFLTKYGGMQSQSFGAATVQKQAQQLMDYAKLIIRNSPALRRRIKSYRDELRYDDGESMHSLSQLSEQQAERADGSNPSFCLYDEAHAFVTDKLKEVIITGMGARYNPLFLTVTTAGFLTVGFPLYTQVELGKKVLDGKVEDDHTFYALYELDSEEEAMGDIAVLEKANPGLGIAVSVERLEQMRDKAKLLPSSWKHFLVKNCNLFQADAADPFIKDDDFVLCCNPFDEAELIGGRCWIGLDLSNSVDLTAATALVEHPKTKVLHVIPLHFFPGSRPDKRVRANGVDLSDWIEQGYIIEHPDRIDYDDVYNRLLTFFKNYNVQCVGYDPFSAHELQAKLKGNLELSHIPIVPVPQSMSVMSPPSKYFEYLVLNKKIELGQNPVLRYCNANARLKFSKTSNLIRISKDDQLNPIDSIISTVVALAVYMNQEYNEINFMDE